MVSNVTLDELVKEIKRIALETGESEAELLKKAQEEALEGTDDGEEDPADPVEVVTKSDSKKKAAKEEDYVEDPREHINVVFIGHVGK
jgi:hypothetical protein